MGAVSRTFSDSGYAARRNRLRELLADRDLPAALITRLVNVRYLTGFTGSNGALLVYADGGALFCTDGRYVDQAGDECAGLDVLVDRQLLPALTRRAVDDGFGRLGLETHVVTIDALRGLESDHPDVESLSLGRAVETLRVDKDDAELAAIAEACAISCRALEALLESGLSGRTEKDIARDLEGRMYDGGAEAVAFDTIVASGSNSAIPHHRPTDRVVGRGDLLKIDFGARYAGYHADCTRTFVVGTKPADWQHEVYETVRAAQAAGCAALASGAECASVDDAARSVIADAGYGDRFTHGLGHGVGLEIHEDPFMSATAEGKLGDRTPVTVEPGIYLPGRGGVRIEDTLVVRDAATELLTPTTKDLLVVD